MATTVLRVLFGASLGLGVLDVAWIDLVAAPAITSRPSPSPSPSPIVVALAEVPTPMPMPAPPPPPAVPPTPAPPVEAAIAPQQIYFASLHAELDDTARTALAAFAATAGDRTIAITGHADYRGGESVNASLRRHRATAARDELARLGVPRDHMTIRVAPPADSSPETLLWRDRRVDLVVDPPGGAP